MTAVSVLAVLPSLEDSDALHAIFSHSNWQLDFVRTFEEAKAALKNGPVGVVISDCRLSDGHCWKNLLNEVRSMLNPPLLIVTDRLADDHLWAEVLNLGAYDLIMKPFDPPGSIPRGEPSLALVEAPIGGHRQEAAGVGGG